MNLLCKLFAGSYENLWKAIIRPSRDKYTSKDLGPYKFELNSKYYKRTDLIITNKRQHKLKCSFWEPFDEEREYDQLPCVIYLHGNSSSRIEALGQLKHLLPLNITVFSFDFSGCGKSEGDYISLGWYESDDVECIINYLRKTNKVSTIGLWGRSMGAVTALLFASRENNHLSAILLDSAFFSLRKLVEELIEKNINIPTFILNSMIETLRKTIIEKADFDLLDIEPYLFCKNCEVPAFFCHGKEDSLINVHHSKDLYKEYPGVKNIALLKGNHNTPRDNEFKNTASLFFYHYLNLNDLRNRTINVNNNISLKSNCSHTINNSPIKLFKNLNNSLKYKTKIGLDKTDNNIDISDISLKDNVNEKNENEKENLGNSNRKIMSYFQKCSSNDLNKINNENKKILLSSEIHEILSITKNASQKNLKEINEIKLNPMDLNKIKKLRTASSTQSIYFEKNINNPFIKSNTKTKPISLNCNLLNDMKIINNKINTNNRYNNDDFFNNMNNKKKESIILNNNIDNKNNTINIEGNFYRKNLNKMKNEKNKYINSCKNPFLFQFSDKNKKNNENEKQQKSFYRNYLSNTINIKRKDIHHNDDKKWIIFEGINPYLKENKNYFKNKNSKKELSLEDEITIKNDDTFNY